jgi:hypothetical protein
MRLTEAQRRAVSAPIFEHFDVWAGYWFTATEDGSGPHINIRTIDALKSARLIERGTNTGVASGRQRCPWLLTDLCRLALTSGSKPE